LNEDYIEIHQGDSITFTLTGDVHSVTFASEDLPDPVFYDELGAHSSPYYFPVGGNVINDTLTVYSSGVLGFSPVISATFTFPTLGEFPFGCILHPAMDGVVNVLRTIENFENY
jgi:plastocyanin